MPRYVKPRIYLAGKIDAHDWRERLVGPGVEIDDDRLFDPGYCVELAAFEYVGPFYVACDHRCAHGPANHGVGASGDAGCLAGRWGRGAARRVFDINRLRLHAAHAVFAYVSCADCYGTLIELGMAAELGKRVAVVFDMDLPAAVREDLWMAGCIANGGMYVTRMLERTWDAFLRTLDVGTTNVTPLRGGR